MKALVIYDSNCGNTKKIAEVVAGEISCDAVNIADIEPSDLVGYDLLVVGTPIIGWMPTERMQAFLSKLKNGQLDGVKATTFDTRVRLFIHGDAMNKLAGGLKKLGAEIIVSPMPFYVAGSKDEPCLLDGEVEKAKSWASKIKKMILDLEGPIAEVEKELKDGHISKKFDNASDFLADIKK